CPDCGKTFGTNSNLIQHLQIHVGEQPFTCGHCRKSFSRSYALDRH
ncbi:Zinc finger protein 358, partial [Pterocles gutturalis]